MLDQTDYTLLQQAQKRVRSETPFLLICVVVFATTVTVVIISSEMWLRILGYVLGAVVFINALGTISSVKADLGLIREFESQLRQNKWRFVEEHPTYDREERTM